MKEHRLPTDCIFAILFFTDLIIIIAQRKRYDSEYKYYERKELKRLIKEYYKENKESERNTRA